MKLPDDIKRHYGRITVIHRCEDSKYGEERYYCICECSQVRLTTIRQLRCGKIKSCGCLCREIEFLAAIDFELIPNENTKVGPYGIQPHLIYEKVAEYAALCSLINERDNEVCQDCGRTQELELSSLGVLLPIHHINQDRSNNSQTNLITLCNSCHSKIHQSINREQPNKWTDEATLELSENNVNKTPT